MGMYHPPNSSQLEPVNQRELKHTRKPFLYEFENKLHHLSTIHSTLNSFWHNTVNASLILRLALSLSLYISHSSVEEL